jgi:hypothetical protein
VYGGWTKLILTLKNVIDIYVIFITLINVNDIFGRIMHKFIEEKDWQGNAEALARHALEWMRIKRIGDPSFEPNERLVRDYVARGILSKPERKGKEAIFGFEQLAQFLACRAVIDDGWPLSKISEDFRVSSMTEILSLIPGEAVQNDALSLVENFKADALFDREPSAPKQPKIMASMSASDEGDIPSFLKRRRESYETKADIKEVLKRFGSDFGNVIREDFTAYQLASWLVLLMDRDKARDITRQEAEDIGRGITAALLNRGSLTKADRHNYTKQMKELSSLDEEKRTIEYDLSHARAEMEKLAIEIEMRREELSILDEKLRRADET